MNLRRHRAELEARAAQFAFRLRKSAAGAMAHAADALRSLNSWASVRLGETAERLVKPAQPAIETARRRWFSARRRITVATRLGRKRLVAALRNSPLAPAPAGLEHSRLAHLPAAGRYRVDVATASTRLVTLGGLVLFALLVALPAFAGRDL